MYLYMYVYILNKDLFHKNANIYCLIHFLTSKAKWNTFPSYSG